MIKLASNSKKKQKRLKDIQHLINILDTFQEFHFISAGIQLGIFDFLENKKIKAETIAKTFGFEKELTKAWCEAATACGYLEKDRDEFYLSRWSKHYLLSHSSTYIGYLCKYTKIIPEAFSDIKARFRGKRPLMETQHAMNTLESIAPIANLAVPILMQEIPILREKCHVLDLGCGLGSYLINFALNNPELTGVGVDGGWIAAIVHEARKNVEKYKLQDRIEIKLADVLELKLNEKFDVILMSGFIQAFKPKNALIILKKARDWLKTNGILILQEMFLDEGRISPKSNVLLNLLLHLETPEAGLFEFNQLEELLIIAKFSEIRRMNLIPQITHIIAY